MNCIAIRYNIKYFEFLYSDLKISVTNLQATKFDMSAANHQPCVRLQKSKLKMDKRVL